MPFQYDNLDRSKNEIRLIRFLRNDKTQLEISLKTVSKDENLSYHCLSYVWGNPATLWPIVVDGAQVLVTQSLGEALRRVEGEQDAEFLWADALCINQKDEAEKLHQIRMINKIYGDAAAVLAWLGPKGNSSGEVMDEISRVGKILLVNLVTAPLCEASKFVLNEAMSTLSLQKIVLVLLDWVDLTDPKNTGNRSIPDFWNVIS